MRDMCARYEARPNYIRTVRRAALVRMHNFALSQPHWLPWFFEYRKRVMVNEVSMWPM